eukprot:766443-Hanusia_phi.AAC.7
MLGPAPDCSAHLAQILVLQAVQVNVGNLREQVSTGSRRARLVGKPSCLPHLAARGRSAPERPEQFFAE